MGAEQECGTGPAISNVEITVRFAGKLLKDLAPRHRPVCDKGIHRIRFYPSVGMYKNAVIPGQRLTQFVQRHSPIANRSNSSIEVLHWQDDRDRDCGYADSACNQVLHSLSSRPAEQPYHP